MDGDLMVESPAPSKALLPPQTPDPFSEERNRHVTQVFREHGERICDILRQSVAEELSKVGVDYKDVRKSLIKGRKSPRPNKTNDGLHRSIQVQLLSGAMFNIPFIVKETCDFIRRNIRQQGIFRISGLASRANGIMQRFSNPEFEDFFVVCDTVHDVASVLKQYLRQLEVPLIPYSIQNVFIQCMDLKPESVRNNALILATCLVPPESVGCLSYILQFLAEVAGSSEENLMTFENLAIIMGLNIMPTDPRKCNDKGKKDIQKMERHTLDLHNKVVEILMKNADKVGVISPEIEKRLDSLLALRSSEDELDNEGGGGRRRKRRRSGSLNRVLGFLKKVTGKNGSETPMTPMMPKTPGADSFSHTPRIKGSVKGSDDGAFSLRKKRNIFDGAGKNIKNEMIGTPCTPLPSKITCPSPAICLNPSPMKTDWKQTPSGNRLRNFVTPALLLRRREKSGDSDKNVFSAPAKPSKIRFGRNKTTKKVTPQKDSELLKSKQASSASTISIHKLTNSPRAARIKPAVPPKRFNSSTLKLRSNSKSSLRETDPISSLVVVNPKLNMSEESVNLPPPTLKLSPLIREINSLTKTANELTLSTLRGKSTSSIRSTNSRTLPESPTEMDTTPISAHHVETKFIQTLKKEPKATEIQELPMNTLQRRLSIQEDRRRSRLSMSPYQRKITSERRKTHEIGRVASVVTLPTRNNPSPDTNSLRRSPSARCTLRRGRPNTARAGLARPSPARNTPRSVTTPGKNIPEPEPTPHQEMDATPSIRRMSSVQELVNKLEINKKQPKQNSQISVPNSIESTTTSQIQIPVITRSKTMEKSLENNIPHIVSPLLIFEPQQSTTEMNWIAGNKFQFDRKDFHGLNKNKKSERDSIHYLKTLRAGNVPATVEYFNKIGHNKSPGKSLIPRYTALHNKPPSPQCEVPTTPSRISRRISSADIDIRNNKREELLESIKKEKAIKRSATTAGAYKNQNARRNVEESTRVSNLKRPTTLNLNTALSQYRSAGITSRSSRITSNPQTPRILEEEESVAVLTAPKETHSKKPINTSPLKTSNVANFSSSYNMRKRNEKITISRTASETGTKATTPRHTTPKVKKAFTTRAYDMRNSNNNFTPLTPKKGTPIKSVVATKSISSHSHARHCPTITPRRRVPRMGNGGNNSEKVRTPLPRATNIFTPSRF